jgi:hypothetical protein
VNKREAHKLVCRCVRELFDGHFNEFLYYSGDDGSERLEADVKRMEEALQDFLDEMYRRGEDDERN